VVPGDLAAEVVDAGDQVVVVMRPPAGGPAARSELRANPVIFRGGTVVRAVAVHAPEDALAPARRTAGARPPE
jgi:hypothetical protein